MAGEAVAERGTGTKTLAAMALEAVERFDGPALKYKEDGDWKELAYEDLGVAIGGVAGGLIDLGIEPGQRVAIFSDTRPEWTLADLGGILASATVVPIYQTASVEEAKHVLGDSEAKLVFCENDELLQTAKEAAEDLSVDTFVTFEGEGAMSLDELREKGREKESEVDKR